MQMWQEGMFFRSFGMDFVVWLVFFRREAGKGGSTASFSGADCSRCCGGGNIGNKMTVVLLLCQEV